MGIKISSQPKPTSQQPKEKATTNTSQKTTTTSQKTPATPSEKGTKDTSDDQSITEEAPPSESNESKGPQSHNYQDAEDVQICKSWLDVSQDPLNLTNQAADTFWTRVAEHYTTVKPDTS
ncbi:hypothetical protein PSTG_03956 [Puccinia striiformis f. sp. tritici PST-78]|uniref:No apical meristem-associated C-terminal domain-containing protein n=1 Tax=Puccinia striiformis f. sp. tritici PST-78 TaxID=1165861 RepID=A0A0L0VUK0_9BASI|nr:hypothetical protein PSTG_03956 [Puccinia striiformis f. sp. tritici PST-78]